MQVPLYQSYMQVPLQQPYMQVPCNSPHIHVRRFNEKPGIWSALSSSIIARTLFAAAREIPCKTNVTCWCSPAMPTNRLP